VCPSLLHILPAEEAENVESEADVFRELVSSGRAVFEREAGETDS